MIIITLDNTDNLIELTRLEPVMIEVEEAGKVSSHLIMFELKCNIGLENDEMIADGEIQETVYELEERNC